jgi:phenylalanine-4-hydroxylase
MTMRRPFKRFSAAEDEIWRALYERQYPQIEKYGTPLWLDGCAAIGLQPDRIPDFEQLNERLQALVGWELVSTDIQYSDGQDWFEALARREFLITEYIRDWDALDYTPMPDIVHDAFGHLPFLGIPRYADYLQHFAQQAIRYPKSDRRSLSNLWWYSIEFGFIWQDGELKAIGAGLMSSYAELQRAYLPEVQRLPYSLEAFENIDPSPHKMHDQLFVFDSFDQIEQSLHDWVKAHPPREVVQF